MPSEVFSGEPVHPNNRGCYQTDTGCVSFEHILKEVSCAERYWTADPEDMGGALYLVDTDKSTMKRWAWDAEDRGYFRSGLLEGETTSKLYDYMYSLNQTECRSVLIEAGIPENEIADNDQKAGDVN